VESSSQLLNPVRAGAIKAWVSSTTPLILHFLRCKLGEDEALARKRVKAILEGFPMVRFRKATKDIPVYNPDLITSCRFVLGEYVERFEKTFAQFEDTGYRVPSTQAPGHCTVPF